LSKDKLEQSKWGEEEQGFENDPSKIINQDKISLRGAYGVAQYF
jgi:hypothetical protein